MGARGPTPIPRDEKERRGTYRPDRDKGAPLKVPRLTTTPPAPSWLSDAAKSEWDRMANELIDVGALSAIDLKVLEGYCAAYGRALRAEKATAKGSLTMSTPQGRIPRPEVNIAKQAWAEMRAFAAKLGATPADRARVTTSDGGPKPVRDEWDEVATG